MAFESPRQMRPWATAIRQSVVKGTMPPWHADAETSVHLADVRALSEGEKKILLGWLDAGMKGEEFQLVAPRRELGWKLGTPDLVVKIPGMKVPANGTLQYTFLVTRLGFEKARWVAAAEWRIDKPEVVHHINAFVRPAGSSYVRQAPAGELYVATKAERAQRNAGEREVERRELLLGYEPGYRPQPWGEGRAKLIPAGADLVFEIHYTANGREVTDSSELGLYFAASAPRERVLTISPADADLEIPAGESNYRSFVTATMKEGAKLVSLQPHMHLRGKAYDIQLRGANGERKPLLRVPRYDFNWQTTYFLRESLALAKGSVIECTAWFDNSPNNRFNPDPTQVIRWGDQSWDEMNLGFLEIAIPADRDPDVATLSGTTRPAGGRESSQPR